jgi:AcrR family transcriptional regulator
MDAQRQRLFAAAAKVFTDAGYADATAEAIARQAGMSKATFYEHFANKEECILALFDAAADEVFRATGQSTAAPELSAGYEEHLRLRLRAFLETLAQYPEQAQTVLVGVIGAGPRASARRDAILDAFADWIYQDNATYAPSFDAPTFASRADAFAVIGGIVEVVSRQLRTGQPADIREVEPTLLRLLYGVLAQGRSEGL